MERKMNSGLDTNFWKEIGNPLSQLQFEKLQKMSLIVLIWITNPYPGLITGAYEIPWLAYIMSYVCD